MYIYINDSKFKNPPTLTLYSKSFDLLIFILHIEIPDSGTIYLLEDDKVEPGIQVS